MITKRKFTTHLFSILLIIFSTTISIVSINFGLNSIYNAFKSTPIFSFEFLLLIFLGLWIRLAIIGTIVRLSVMLNGIFRPTYSKYRFAIPIILIALNLALTIFDLNHKIFVFDNNPFLSILFLVGNITLLVSSLKSLSWFQCPSCGGYNYTTVTLQTFSKESWTEQEVRTRTERTTVKGRNLFGEKVKGKVNVDVPYIANVNRTKINDECQNQCGDCSYSSTPRLRSITY